MKDFSTKKKSFTLSFILGLLQGGFDLGVKPTDKLFRNITKQSISRMENVRKRLAVIIYCHKTCDAYCSVNFQLEANSTWLNSAWVTEIPNKFPNDEVTTGKKARTVITDPQTKRTLTFGITKRVGWAQNSTVNLFLTQTKGKSPGTPFAPGHVSILGSHVLWLSVIRSWIGDKLWDMMTFT